MSYLARLYDPALALEPATTVASLTAEEVGRLQRCLAVAVLAATQPRRLGSEAAPEELALDKLRGRRVAHVFRQCLGSWQNGDAVPPSIATDPNVRSEAASLDWKALVVENNTYVSQRRVYIATWGLKGEPENEAWAKKAVVRLENEMNWLTYALRD